MKKVARLLLFSLLLSCSRDEAIWQTTNLNSNSISAFGHGGMGIFFKYPIDSYESFEPCFRIGAEGSDIDVQMTKDSVLILYHHQKLKDGTLCEGIVNEKNWSEIKDCLHASPYSNSVNILTAQELLIAADLNKLTITFDCKLYEDPTKDHIKYLNTFADALIRLTQQYGISGKSFVESGDTTFLRILKNKNADLKLFIYPDNFQNALAIADKMDLYGITINNEKITEAQVLMAHEHGRRVTLWDIRTENANIEAIQKNPDFIQSDKIIHLLKVFGKYKKQPLKEFFHW